MATTYTETPNNFCEIEAFVETEIKGMKSIFFSAEKVFFYDACSFQRHSNQLFKVMNGAGVKVVIFNEEYTYDILSECFSTNEKINEYLMWAVRTVKSPVSTIEETLKADKKLTSEVI